jgi:hypothetical protein
MSQILFFLNNLVKLCFFLIDYHLRLAPFTLVRNRILKTSRQSQPCLSLKVAADMIAQTSSYTAKRLVNFSTF